MTTVYARPGHGGRGATAAALLAVLLATAVWLIGSCGGQHVSGAARATGAALLPSTPTEISIERIGVRSSLVGLGLNQDQTVQVPSLDTPMQAGWYRHGPTPGEAGPAVVLGHVDARGRPAIFHRLHELRAGDEVQVRRADGGLAVFTVTRAEQVPKAQFPTDRVYGSTPGPELRLITCGGSFDRKRGSYRDNVIVYAILSGLR